MTAPKTDFKKTHKALYTATADPCLVDVPDLPFLMIDGVGDPDGDRYARAVEALYGVAYTVRFALKNAGVLEYPVMPLEGQWWPEDERYESYADDRDSWHWTMMIMQPPQASPGLVQDALATASAKKPHLPVQSVRLARLHEGTCAQILHTGPYAAEPATLARLYAFLDERGRAITGRHHEIYLSSPRRTAPERLRTILRYPVAPAS